MSETGEILRTLMSAWQALQAEAQAYPTGIRIWMGVMATLFFGGIVFTPWRVQARFVVGVMVATFIALVLGKVIWPELPRATIGAFTHIVLWSPLLVILVWDRVRVRRRDRGTGPFDTLYGVWLYAVIAVLTISLLLDTSESLNFLARPTVSQTSAQSEAGRAINHLGDPDQV